MKLYGPKAKDLIRLWNIDKDEVNFMLQVPPLFKTGASTSIFPQINLHSIGGMTRGAASPFDLRSLKTSTVINNEVVSRRGRRTTQQEAFFESAQLHLQLGQLPFFIGRHRSTLQNRCDSQPDWN